MYKVFSISDVRAANRAAGYHFFDRATVRFFGSSVVSTLYKNLCFVTSELDYSGTRYYYTVRQFDPKTAQIETVGTFQEYRNIYDAREYIKFWNACLRRAKRYWATDPETLDRIQDPESGVEDQDEDEE